MLPSEIQYSSRVYFFLFHHLSSFCFCFYLLLSLLPAMSLAPLYELECNIHYLSFQFKTPEETSSHSLIEKRNRAAYYHHHYALPSTFALTATQCTPYTLHIYPVVKDPPPTLRSSQHFWIPHRSNASGNTDETDETESTKVREHESIKVLKYENMRATRLCLHYKQEASWPFGSCEW